MTGMQCRPGRVAVCVLLILTAGTSEAITCGVTATGVAFGAYNVSLPTPNDSTGSVTVNCTRQLADTFTLTVSYVITFSQGTSGSYAVRQMASGPNRLNYNLYRNAPHTEIWGNGTGPYPSVSGSFTWALLDFSTKTATHTSYGRVPALQSVGTGNYSDSILVTVTY
jgi:spore coat protein U-like protein